jgi:uncharacterized protein YfbU (UPF0304 family)
MNLSKGEKLILLMLADVQKALSVKAPAVDAELVQKAIYKNQTWAIDWEYSMMLGGKDDDPKHVKETADILSMYRVIKSSFDALSKPEQDSVRSRTGHSASYLEFQGFDGNHDKHFGVARFMADDMEDAFAELKGKNLNSHSSATLPRYFRMLGAYNHVLGQSGHFVGLSSDQIVQILTA